MRREEMFLCQNFIRNKHDNKMTTTKKNEPLEEKKGKQVIPSEFLQGHILLPIDRSRDFPSISKIHSLT